MNSQAVKWLQWLQIGVSQWQENFTGGGLGRRGLSKPSFPVVTCSNLEGDYFPGKGYDFHSVVQYFSFLSSFPSHLRIPNINKEVVSNVGLLQQGGHHYYRGPSPCSEWKTSRMWQCRPIAIFWNNHLHFSFLPLSFLLNNRFFNALSPPGTTGSVKIKAPEPHTALPSQDSNSTQGTNPTVHSQIYSDKQTGHFFISVFLEEAKN